MLSLEMADASAAPAAAMSAACCASPTPAAKVTM
jgi:hypothetical protein